ncbi:multidrug effflux MFS transporter [Pseudonocardia eucalypti]|uniref:Multidrug effflux MFS transporter n=1 Tax=Pseudonocardia eucalypti TaxID=648755 RepID=A0ABP9RF43_9PSEU|nr:DHA1 family bicyclomycin/chloramphenicol resistance-like MFS transporter [Pseudonocardia eucalypti]
MIDVSVARARGAAPLKLVAVLGLMFAIGPIGIDMYLPAMPAIGRELASADTAVQLTLTGYGLGMGLGQLLVGPWSDAVGRRRPMLIGLALFAAASLACAAAPTVPLLALARLAQGLAISSGSVLAMAVVRDLFTDSAASTLLSRLMLVLSASPILAPSLGSLVLGVTVWPGIFVTLGLVGVLLALVVLRTLPETLPPDRRRPLNAGAVARSYVHLLRDRRFVGLVVATGLATTGLLGFVTGSPFVFQHQLGLDERRFGLLFAASVLWMIAATQVNARLMRRLHPRQVLLPSTAAATGTALLALGLALTGLGGAVGLIGALWLTLFFIGFALPNLPAVILADHPDAAGTASALIGASQMVIASALSPLVGVFGNDGAAMAGVIAAALGASTLILLTAQR